MRKHRGESLGVDPGTAGQASTLGIAWRRAHSVAGGAHQDLAAHLQFPTRPHLPSPLTVTLVALRWGGCELIPAVRVNYSHNGQASARFPGLSWQPSSTDSETSRGQKSHQRRKSLLPIQEGDRRLGPRCSRVAHRVPT